MQIGEFEAASEQQQSLKNNNSNTAFVEAMLTIKQKNLKRV